MKILHCDSCHAEVNDYSHWYNDAQPRNMYELKCVHESGSDTYNGMIICHECIAKLLHKTESVTEFADRCRECGAKYGKLLKQKSGKWIEHFDESGKWYECDQCHTDWGGSFNYCPNCGAKM